MPSDVPPPMRYSPPRGAAAASLSRRFAGAPTPVAVRRIEPWSVFVMSLLLSLFLAVMTVVAALVLYLVLSQLGVPASINRNVNDVKGGGDVFTMGRFMGGAALLAAANVVLLTAAATVGAVLYNLCATFAGGVDVTFAEGE